MIRYFRGIAFASVVLLSVGAATARFTPTPQVQFSQDGVIIRGDFMLNS